MTPPPGRDPAERTSRFLGRPTSVETALSFTAVLLSFLAIHYSQQWRRKCPSNTYARFGPRWSFKSQLRDLAYPSPNFYRGVKKCEIWHCFQHSSKLSGPRLKTQHDIWSLKQSVNSDIWSLCVLQGWCSSIHAPLRSIRGFGPGSKIWRPKMC